MLKAFAALESFAGAIRMRVPRSASALFTLEAFAGEIRSDIPMTMQSSTGRGSGFSQRRVLRLGDGKARVSLKSFSGAIIIQPLDG